MVGKIEGRRRRGWQRMRWLDGSTDSMDIVWVNSSSWWWTRRPGVPRFMGLQSQTRLSNWTELNWIFCYTYILYFVYPFIGWWPLCGFHLLAFVNSIATSTGIKVFRAPIFSSFGYIPGGTITRSYSNAGEFPGGSESDESAWNSGDPGSIPVSGRSPGEGNEWQPTPVFLLGEFHEQRSLAGYSPQDCKE